MKAFALIHPGLENISAEEIKKLLKAKNVQTKEGIILFETDNEEDLARLCYHGRTILKVALLLEETKTSSIEDFKIPDVQEYIAKRAVARCERYGEHQFTSFDIEQKQNGILKKNYEVEIDHKNPETIIFTYVRGDKAYTGIDFSGIDLGKRDYRIFLGRESLKGTFAAGMLKLAGFEPDKSLLDPFCRQGIIPIEAALMATNTSTQKFAKEKLACLKLPGRKFELQDKEIAAKKEIICMDSNFKHVSASKKNAKISGAVKSIQFSRTQLEWLDAKFQEKSIDLIVTYPVQPSNRLPFERVKKTYDQLFYQAKFILKDKGKICICMRSELKELKQATEKHGLELERKHEINQGKKKYHYYIFCKK